MSMVDLRFKAKKVNLVERREWDDYDTAGALNDIIFMNAADTFSQMDPDALDSRIDDVLSVGAKKRSRVSEDETKAIFEAMKRGELETFEYLIRDWLSWTWEKAFIPTDNDIRDALDKAIDSIGDEWRSHMGDYDALWAIAETIGPTPTLFLKELIGTSVVYEREPGWHDRYLVFDPELSLLVTNLLLQPIQAPEKGVLEWTPPLEIPKEDIKNEIEVFFKGMEDTVIGEMFRALKKDMDEADPDNRTDFNWMWKDILETDPERVKAAKKELKEFLKGLP